MRRRQVPEKGATAGFQLASAKHTTYVHMCWPFHYEFMMKCLFYILISCGNSTFF